MRTLGEDGDERHPTNQGKEGVEKLNDPGFSLPDSYRTRRIGEAREKREGRALPE